MIWLSHWRFQNQLEAGDELNVLLLTMDGIQVKEVGIHLVYEEQEEKGTLSNDLWPEPIEGRCSTRASGNETRDLKWIYGPTCFGIPETDEDMIWLSHWRFQNQLEAGDKLNVLLLTMDRIQVKEVGIHLMYEEQEEKGTLSKSKELIQQTYPWQEDFIPEKVVARRGSTRMSILGSTSPIVHFGQYFSDWTR
ncbi:hypothetical protein F0562_029124 [Nyssa sinensis]|uniref:Uncharacterized protein n=1 Tax=Nyssa sinensis TaxID=561372 RepID=A0A5J5B322_9ASTE|nr:hypothetical protein F0562_029124 [Nyssa sinensis]